MRIGGETVKKKIIAIFLALITVAALSLSISMASATKPETMTLTGKVFVLGLGNSIESNPGNSGNEIVKIRDVPVKWTGDITANGFLCANRLDLGDDEIIDAFAGAHFLKDALVSGVGTGDLAIGVHLDGNGLFIKSGSGDLRSIRGTGTSTQLNAFTYSYEIVIQINP